MIKSIQGVYSAHSPRQVGVWKGSSVFAALSGNPGCAVTAIDNWSEFNGASARREFAAAAEALLSADERLRLTVGF